MNPREWLDCADEWAVGDTEAFWRTAVGRAYYANFHLAARLLAACGFAVPPAEGAHAYVSRRLSNCGHPTLEGAGRDLNHLRSRRNAADYDLDRPFPQRFARELVGLALKLADLLGEALAGPAVRARITAAVRDYERDVLRENTHRG